MKKGIRRPLFFPPEWDLDRCFGEAASRGFAGVELIYRAGLGATRSRARADLVAQEGYRSWQTLPASVTGESTKADCAGMAALAAEKGVVVAGLASGYSPIDTPDSPAFESTRESIEKAIARTAWVGGDNLLVAFESAAPDAPDDAVRQWVAELLKRVAPAATERSVALAYELVWPAPYDTPDEMLGLLESVGSPAVGVYFDPANALQRIDERDAGAGPAILPEDWLRALLPWLKRFHMKDYTLGPPAGYADLLRGGVNWPTLRRLLADGGYDGWLVAEIEVDPPNRLGAVARVGAAIDRFLDGDFREPPGARSCRGPKSG